MQDAAFARLHGLPMFNLVSGSMRLGRIFSTVIRLHWLFVVFAATIIVRGALQAPPARGALEACGCMVLLLLATMLRESGQLVLLPRLGLPGGEIRLWPLGNFVTPSDHLAGRSPESAVLATSSLATSLALAVGTGVGLALFGARLELNPFGGLSGGAPLLSGGKVAPSFSSLWWMGWFGYLNWVLFLANLIPALPFDMGRIVRGFLGTSQRENELFPYLARVVAVILALVGLSRLYSGKDGGVILIALAVLMEWLVRVEGRHLEDWGDTNDGLFGYDFSQGYTSLEAGASVARPKKHGALRRWQSRRSELRRQRRLAQDSADESRLDEILIKLHEKGRDSLRAEEYRFLVRVSARLRQRRTRES